MVQMVFVHGVATRSGSQYYQEERTRHKLFKEILFEGAPLSIRAPRWGDLIPPMSHGGAAFAGAGGGATFGAFGGIGGAMSGAAEGNTVAELAKLDSAAAVDAVYATIVDQADKTGRDLTTDDVDAFKAAVKAISDEGAKPVIPESATDEELIYNLGTTISSSGSYGIGSQVKTAVIALADRARNLVSTGLSDAFRDDLNPMVGRFLGDVFAYLKDGYVRNEVRALVAADIVAAQAEAKTGGEPLILLGHSLGGVILYDMLSSPAQSGLPADLTVDLLLTVGSQPGLFEEMGLFDFKSVDAGSTPGPGSVKAWLNVFDPIDVFGFRATPIFAKPIDFAFDSVTGLLSAHTTYFKRPQFHARARKRLHDLGLV